MNKEQLERLKELKSKAADGPVYVSGDDATDCPSHKQSGLAKIDTGRAIDWPIARLQEWNEANYYAAIRNAAPALIALAEWADKAREYVLSQECICGFGGGGLCWKCKLLSAYPGE